MDHNKRLFLPLIAVAGLFSARRARAGWATPGLFIHGKRGCNSLSHMYFARDRPETAGSVRQSLLESSRSKERRFSAWMLRATRL